MSSIGSVMEERTEWTHSYAGQEADAPEPERCEQQAEPEAKPITFREWF